MDLPRFSRTIEDFTCLRCAMTVKGDGFTNHCPFCLWSKHVDINPGDRAAACGGAMEPIGVETIAGEYVLLHRCERCGFERRQRSAKGDDFDALLEIVRRGKI